MATQGIYVTYVGIGSDFNQKLTEKITVASGGSFFTLFYLINVCHSLFLILLFQFFRFLLYFHCAEWKVRITFAAWLQMISVIAL
jgi:hypothetical protein